jgi:hypothetical protein
MTELKHGWIASEGGPVQLELTWFPAEPGGEPRIWARYAGEDRWYIADATRLFASESGAITSLIKQFTDSAASHDLQAAMHRNQAREDREQAARWAKRREEKAS